MFTLPYEGQYTESAINAYDYRLLLGDSTEFKSSGIYDLGTGIRDEASTYNDSLLTDNPPENFSLSVQPVTITEPQNNQNLNPQSELTTQGLGYKLVKRLF